MDTTQFTPDAGEMLRALREDRDTLHPLVFRAIESIWMSEDHLTFKTTSGHLVSYGVEGDCCSTSYFYDFHGVPLLLSGGMVTAFEQVELAPGDPGYRAATWEPPSDDYDCVKVYGYRITVEDPTWGPRSAVFSFRNRSNGYYSGSMHTATVHLTDDVHRLTADKIGD